MTYLNFGQCQGEKKNHKKNCNKAKKWEKQKRKCVYVYRDKNDVQSVKNEKRLKIKRENNNSGLLLC